jgi:hypothetical protein
MGHFEAEVDRRSSYNGDCPTSSMPKTTQPVKKPPRAPFLIPVRGLKTPFCSGLTSVSRCFGSFWTTDRSDNEFFNKLHRL